MNLISDFEAHKRDEDFDREDDKRRRPVTHARASRADAIAIREALDNAMRLLCPVVQAEHLYGKQTNGLTVIGLDLNWTLDDLTNCIKQTNRAVELIEARDANETAKEEKRA